VALIAMALAKSPRLSGKYWEVPSAFYPPIEQVLVPLNSSAHPDLARRFAAFMLGAEARQVLQQFGFALPGSAP
jgi:ABC-type molybdate transport system substrate-binding protein